MLMLIRFVVFDVIGLLFDNEDKSVFSVVALVQTFIGSVRCVEVATLTVQEPACALIDSDCAIEMASSYGGGASPRGKNGFHS